MTIPVVPLSAHVNQDSAVLDPYGIRLQWDDDGCTQGLAGLIVEAPMVLGALDGVAPDQPVGEADALVRTQAGGGEILVLRTSVDSDDLTLVIEADHVLRVDVARGAGPNPRPLRFRDGRRDDRPALDQHRGVMRQECEEADDR